MEDPVPICTDDLRMPVMNMKLNMGVEQKIGVCLPPKSSILIGFSIINHPFWGPLFLETPTYNLIQNAFYSWLVVFSHPSEKYAQVKMGSSSPNRGEHEKYLS